MFKPDGVFDKKYADEWLCLFAVLGYYCLSSFNKVAVVLSDNWPGAEGPVTGQ